MDLHNIDPNVAEKVERLSDILVEFGYLPLLNGRLSLYGGTALNFIHLEDIPRLSEDLDFNYRHSGEKDWGDVRSDIDEIIKGVLYRLGYSTGDIKIQSFYNLMRFHIHYVTRGKKRDSIKIEIGYSRRMPVLDSDVYLPFKHPATGILTKVLTPQSEELYANKVTTLLSRGLKGRYPRDIFDVSVIAGREFDRARFMDAMMIEALMSDLDFVDRELKPPDRSLYYGLRRLLIKKYDLTLVFRRADEFLKTVVSEMMERNWEDFREEFINTGRIDRGYLADPSVINPSIESHPQLLWLRQRLD